MEKDFIKKRIIEQAHYIREVVLDPKIPINRKMQILHSAWSQGEYFIKKYVEVAEPSDLPKDIIETFKILEEFKNKL